MKTLHRATLTVCTLVVAPITALAQTPSFNLVGIPAGSSGSSVRCISADGTVAAGFATAPSAAQSGFTWTAAGGRNDFGLQAGMPSSSPAFGISGDGSVVVGDMPVGSTFGAYRWNGSGPLQNLGLVANYTRAEANGVSGDGSVAVGWCERGPNTQFDGQAFRWTASGGMQGLGFARPGDFFSEATAISRDGNTIVGWSSNSGANATVPFVWTQGGGMHELPMFSGAPFLYSAASGVNATGTIIVGASAVGPTGNLHAAEWVGGAIIDLGLPAGYFSGAASALSDDGSVVIGGIAATNTNIPAVWTAQGVSTLADYLAANGVQVPAGWSLEYCLGVSSDGLTFVGQARLASGQSEGFVATVPAPAWIGVLVAAMYVPRSRQGVRA